jgi:predicted RNase H-like nuclease
MPPIIRAVTVFVGLDLAWTPHHESGVCVLAHDSGDVRLVTLGTETATPERFADLCCEGGEDVVVAVDAPLLVSPGRRAERELAVVFGRAKASAYTATIEFLTKMNGLAGPALARLLAERGFETAPSRVAAGAGGRYLLEVFPHPAHVELFALEERLAYKKGRVASRRIAFAAYQAHLGSLLGAELPALLDDERVLDLLSPEALILGGRALKRVEDQLDALTCAFVAYHCWKHGAAGFRVFGDETTGAIVVPRRLPVTSSLAPSSP